MKINDLSVLLMELSFHPDVEEENRIIQYIEKFQFRDESDEEGRTILMNAACYGLSNILKYCINEKFLMNNIDFQGRSALHLAVLNDHQDIVNILIDNGIDKDVVDIFGNKAFDYSN